MRPLRTAQLLFVCFRSRQHPFHDKAPLVPFIIDNRPDPVASGRTPSPSSSTSSSSSFGVVGDSDIMERPDDDRSENNRVGASSTAPTTTTPSPVVVSERVRELLRREAGHDPTAPDVVRKRRSEDVLPWDDYFLAVAALSAKRSKDPSASGGGGACIVDAKRRVVGVGYDGLPRGCDDDLVPWGDDENDETTTDFLRTKHAYVVKAEVNAVLNRCSADVDGATMYVLRYPCHESAKIIVQAGVAEVVWPESDDDASTSNEDTYRASRLLFEMAGVRTRAHRPKRSRIVLDLGAAAAAADADATSNDDAVVDDAARERDEEHRPTPEQERRRREKAKALLLREAGYDPDDPEQRRRQRPSSSYLSWDDYFLALSFLSARRSKDPNTQVGACLVNRDRRVVGIGYNGFPRGCDDDHLPWGRVAESPLRTKYPYVVHAEVNALLNKGDAVLDGATLYVALFPCNDCAKTLVQAGVREIVYLEDKYHDTDSCRASRIMLGMAGVRCRRHAPGQTRIVLDLTRDADDSNDAT